MTWYVRCPVCWKSVSFDRVLLYNITRLLQNTRTAGCFIAEQVCCGVGSERRRVLSVLIILSL